MELNKQTEAQYDLCIVGAGVAGAALANALKESGLKICVIEKDWREQDRIVGELLQPDGVNQLQEMGLSHLLTDYDAQKISGYTILYEGKQLAIPYPNLETGRGLRNGKFVQKMRTLLLASEKISCVEGDVCDLMYHESEQVTGVKIKSKGTENETIISANMTVISDGFFSKLRKKVTNNTEKVTGYFLGMILENYTLPNNEHGHVFLTDANPFLCYPISGNEARLLIDFTSQEAPRKGEELTTFLSTKIRPYLTKEMLPIFDKAMIAQKFKVMPNHYMPSKERKIDGVVILGDALNMRHPLTGGGMTVTLRDVKKLSDLLKTNSLDSSENRLVFTAAFYESRKQHATVNILADALHEVMGNKELKKACFDYLYEGGKKAAEPIALLSGLEKRKSILAKHFFAVAIQGGVKKIRTDWQLKNWQNAYHMIGDAYQIIYPLIKNETKSKSASMVLDVGRVILNHKRQSILAEN